MGLPFFPDARIRLITVPCETISSSSSVSFIRLWIAPLKRFNAVSALSCPKTNSSGRSKKSANLCRKAVSAGYVVFLETMVFL